MLSNRYPADTLASILLPRTVWQPYPTLEQREDWQALPDVTRAYVLARGEAALGADWPTLPATLFLEYARIGNRANFEHVQSMRRTMLRDLVLAECVEGEGRFLDDIANGIWTTCEETYWGYPAHVNAQAAGVDLPDVEEPTVDLFAGEASALLAWSVALLGKRLDAVSPLVRRRAAFEVKRRVLDPCLARDDFWWMGFDPGEHGVNNWNPWVNSNWLASVLLLEEDPERRVAAVDKILRSLDVFLGIYAETGGCDEGPSYWGRAAASLFDCLDLLHSATGGQLDLYADAKIANMGRYIYRAHIAGDYVVNFADASAVNRPPASLVYRYGTAIRDLDMMRFGAWLLEGQSEERGKQEGSMGRILPALFDIPEVLPVEAAPPLPREFWFAGIQVLVARDTAGTADGFFLAAKAGHNAESHNHNDVGSFIVYIDGKPLIVDAGVETYRRQTFSPRRYEIWTMQSAYHTLLPSFERPGQAVVQQLPGDGFAARAVQARFDDAEARLALDLAGTYPAGAGLLTWSRVVTLKRGAAVIVEDAFTLTSPVERIYLSLLTPCDVEVGKEGGVRFAPATFGPSGKQTSGAARLSYDAAVFGVSIERIPITDTRLGGVWGDGLNRIVFTAEAPPRTGTWTWRVTR
jgi:hypothetical protein